MNAKLAYSPSEVKEVGGPGKTRLYQDIKAGRLHAHKMGSRTVILAEDLQAYLTDLPVLEAGE